MKDRLKTAIYIDFDNFYGAVIAILNVPLKSPTPFQTLLLREFLIEFLRSIRKENIQTKASQDFPHNPICIKVFAEYENLPLKERFSPNLPTLLHNVGVIPINPFISEKKKNRNSADLALVLSSAEDLLIKQIPADIVIVSTCDIDLFPAILWLKEHTGKPIILATFKDRVKKTYLSTLVEHEIWFLDNLIPKVFLKTVERMKNFLKRKDKKIGLHRQDIDFFTNLKKKYIPHYDYESVESVIELERQLESLLLETEARVPKDKYDVFKKKLRNALKTWLNKEEFAGTGLIINNWLPQWKLGIDEKTANQYLKKFIEELQLDDSVAFQKEREANGVIIGKFYKK